MERSANVIDSFVRSLVRKNPGLTMVVWMPNGSTSGRSDSIQPSRPNFDAACAEQNSGPTRPAPDEIEMMWPERCLRMTGRTARVTFIGPSRLVASCRSICSGQLLEVAGIEVGGVVDQHVDAAEALDGGLHHCLGVGTAGDVELDDQQVVRLADGIRHGVGVAAGAGDEPNLLLSHVLQVPSSICFLLAARGRLTGRSPAPRTPGR